MQPFQVPVRPNRYSYLLSLVGYMAVNTGYQMRLKPILVVIGRLASCVTGLFDDGINLFIWKHFKIESIYLYTQRYFSVVYRSTFDFWSRNSWFMKLIFKINGCLPSFQWCLHFNLTNNQLWIGYVILPKYSWLVCWLVGWMVLWHVYSWWVFLCRSQFNNYDL